MSLVFLLVFCYLFCRFFVSHLPPFYRSLSLFCHLLSLLCHFFVTSLSASFSASFSAICRLFIVLCHFFVSSLSALCQLFVSSLSALCQLFVGSLSDFQERGHLNALVENGASVQSLASKLDDEVDVCLCRMELLHEVVGCFHAAAGGQQIVVE